MRFVKRVLFATAVLAPFGQIFSVVSASPIEDDGGKHPRSDSLLPIDVESDDLSSVMEELATIMPSHSLTGSLRGPPHAGTATDSAGSAKSLLTVSGAERQELLLEEFKDATKRIGRIDSFLSADSVLMSALTESQRPMFASLQTQLVLAQNTSEHMISLFEEIARAKSKSSSKEASRRYLSDTADERLIGDEQESLEPEFRSSSKRHKKDHSSSRSQHSFFGGAGTHDAFNGDWSFDAKFFQTHHAGRKITNRVPVHPHGRNLFRGEEKKDQCELLIECVEAMSLYDIVIFFYQDDINFEDGTFDNDITEYDEANHPTRGFSRGIMAKYLQIRTRLAQAKIQTSRTDGFFPFPRDQCDLLLREFHFTVESEFGPLSYAGNVTNVCIAQGTTQFVKISEIGTAVDVPAANRISEEVFSCAKELHNSRPMGADSPFANDKFVFTADSGTFRLPSGIKKEGDSRDEHGQLISTDPAKFFDFAHAGGKSLSRDNSCFSVSSLTYFALFSLSLLKTSWTRMGMIMVGLMVMQQLNKTLESVFQIMQ
jgi:hypothetical protein